MNRSGFTLMELLLVVAILAIVAAVAAPTFSKGAADAILEARKSNFLSAYQNAVTGANMMIAIQTAQGLVLGGTNKYIAKGTKTGFLEDKDIEGFKEKNGVVAKGLQYYSPAVSRIFTDINGNSFGWSAIMAENNKYSTDTVSFVLIRVQNGKTQISGDANGKIYGVTVSSYENPAQKLNEIWNNGDVTTYYESHKTVNFQKG